MTEKRFKLIYINEQHISANLYDNGIFIGSIEYGEELIVEVLNQLSEENEQLKHNNKMLSMKMSEVSTKYRLLKEFSEDTNPNEAVKTVLHELMMITKEYR